MVKQRIIDELSPLRGLPLTAARRAADMLTLQFGELRPVKDGSVGDYALHVQCAWRIEDRDGILTGRFDLWEPLEVTPNFDWKNWDYEKGPNLRDALVKSWLAEYGPSLIVIGIDADEYGGAALNLGEFFVLRIFPAGSHGEDWRFFPAKKGRKKGSRHFVISGGRIESDD